MDQVNNMGNVYARNGSNSAYIIIGWLSAVLSLLKLPFIFGVFGVIMGILSTREGSRAGLILIVGSMALMAIGLMLNGALYNYLKSFLY